MTAFTPADQAERDAIRSELNENMCVEAGAGTGKTTVLVARIVNLLASGAADVRKIAVMTFTEKAAAELASRVRSGLEVELAKTGEGTAEHARIAAALRDLNHAHIETIHAFASSLLRERPVEAGLDPGFEMLDELEQQLGFEAAYSEWLGAQMAQEPAPEALADALNLGLELGRIREAAERLNDHRELLPLAGYPRAEVDVAGVIAELARLGADLRAMCDHCDVESDHALITAREALKLVDAIVALRGEPKSAERTIAFAASPTTRNGQRGNWRGIEVNDVREHLKEIARVIRDAKLALRENATAALVMWLQDFVTSYAERRKATGKADFNDLLIWARDLLKHHPDARAYYQRKYERVLVDEFQDTDSLQAEMIVSLCAHGDVADNWRETPLRPGSLFVVGDPKQSIYRFRRADITMYDDVKTRTLKGVRIIRQNFRSAAPVIDWVNGVFGSMFAPQPGVQPEYTALAAHPAFASSGAVMVLEPPPSAEYSGVAGARAGEGAAIASLIADNIANQRWQVRDSEPREELRTRPATFHDVVIIVPSRTDLFLYEDALTRAGVPHRHEGGRAFYTRQEVSELVAILRAVDDPNDGVSCIAALRSPAFGCSDEDLILYKHASHSFDAIHPSDGAPEPVRGALAMLRGFSRMRHERPLPDLVRAILDQTRLVEFAMLQPQGAQVAANLLKVIDQARAYTEVTGGGLRGFVRWLKENIDREAVETDASISEETDDVVRILTIHAAKGLEFPVVVLANMCTQRPDTTTVIADVPAARLHVRLGKAEHGFRTPGYETADDNEASHRLAEEARKLYVAATRAKDHLIVALANPGRDRDTSHGEMLRIHGAAAAGYADISSLPRFDAEIPVWARAVEGATPDERETVIAARDTWIDAHNGTVARGGRPLTIRTATSMKAGAERVAFSDQDVRRARAADFGSAVHAVLERSDLRDERIDALAAAAADEFGQQDRADEIARIARAALASGIVSRARASGRWLLEAPFTAALPEDEAAASGLAEGLAEGRIDLMFVEDGALVIVDFKTDNVRGAAIDTRALEYRTQALVYAWAAHRATSLPVREVVLLFCAPGEERSFPCDAAFMAEAEALMRTAADPEDAENLVEV